MVPELILVSFNLLAMVLINIAISLVENPLVSLQARSNEMYQASFEDMSTFTFFTIEGFRYCKLPNIPAIIESSGKSLHLNSFSFDFQCYVMIKDEVLCTFMVTHIPNTYPYYQELCLN
jgi:hypothetical protein